MQNIAVAQSTYESMPIFPLPDFVVYPNTVTRLRVFESRYRLLTADVLAGNRLMVLVGLKPGYQDDYYGSPPIFQVGSLCKVVNEERLDDGCYNLSLHCLARVEIERVHRLKPYRVATVNQLPDIIEPAEDLEETISRLTSCIRGLVMQLGDADGLLLNELHTKRKPDILTNRLATYLAREPGDRQRLLEEPSVKARAERLTDIVGDMMLRSVQMGLSGETELLVN
ncbi:MAG: hypothetical protein CMH53_06730 [Myxococcales bacterium]|nr:hypothetical protein [Myxococcales bacterium]